MKKLLLGVLLLLAACSPDTEVIDVRNPATLRDDIFSVEPRTNGTYTIWLVHDDTAAYCTSDKVIGETALRAVRSRDALVVMTYVSILTNDKEYWGNRDTGCRAEGAKWINKIVTLEVIP